MIVPWFGGDKFNQSMSVGFGRRVLGEDSIFEVVARRIIDSRNRIAAAAAAVGSILTSLISDGVWRRVVGVLGSICWPALHCFSLFCRFPAVSHCMPCGLLVFRNAPRRPEGVPRRSSGGRGANVALTSRREEPSASTHTPTTHSGGDRESIRQRRGSSSNKSPNAVLTNTEQKTGKTTRKQSSSEEPHSSFDVGEGGERPTKPANGSQGYAVVDGGVPSPEKNCVDMATDAVASPVAVSVAPKGTKRPDSSVAEVAPVAPESNQETYAESEITGKTSNDLVSLAKADTDESDGKANELAGDDAKTSDEAIDATGMEKREPSIEAKSVAMTSSTADGDTAANQTNGSGPSPSPGGKEADREEGGEVCDDAMDGDRSEKGLQGHGESVNWEEESSEFSSEDT